MNRDYEIIVGYNQERIILIDGKKESKEFIKEQSQKIVKWGE